MIRVFNERFFQTDYRDVLEKSSDLFQNFISCHFKSSDLFRNFINTLVAEIERIAPIFISKQKTL